MALQHRRTTTGCQIQVSKYWLLATWKKSSGSSLEIRRDPSRWPRDTLYPQKLALHSPTGGGRSICMVRLRTSAAEFSSQTVIKGNLYNNKLTNLHANFARLEGTQVFLKI
jgi:hypothetical protein